MRRAVTFMSDSIMSDSMPDETRDVLAFVADEALRYLTTLDEQRVRMPNADAAALSFSGALPEEGDGARVALLTLLRDGLDGATRSSGPRFFHFVTGGGTPAALAADWLTSLLDQNA